MIYKKGPAMHIDEFESKLRAEVHEFFVKWREEHVIDAEMYPSKMPEGDWWEQFASAIN